MMFDYSEQLLSPCRGWVVRSEFAPAKDTSKIAAKKYSSTRSQPTGAGNAASFKHFGRILLH